MSSNNPFASALNEQDSYVHHRGPPPPPATSGARTSGTPPVRPPKPADSFAAPPPSYEEVASPDREYPREKSSSSARYQQTSASSSRQYRSNSDTSRPHRHKSSSDHDRDRDRDRERRHHKSSRNKSPSKKKQPEPVKAKNLDTIDKLDVTGFFGGGFHHDGPFDACTPHRNKNIKQAPVMAFPVDGPNNSIKGLAPTSKDDQMNLAFGTYETDQNEIVNRKASIKKPTNTKVTTKNLSSNDGSDENLANPLIKTNRQSDDLTTTLYTPKQNPSVINFDANRTAEPIHGSTTAGLGSSTFLDGAPAPRINDEYLSVNNGGLGRKKSLVQRLRKNSSSENSSRRNSHDNTLGQSHSPPTSRPSFGDDEINGSSGGNSLLRRVKSLKVGGRK